eukprot:493012-Pleurochrysis_carterae.AAC.1
MGSWDSMSEICDVSSRQEPATVPSQSSCKFGESSWGQLIACPREDVQGLASATAPNSTRAASAISLDTLF